MVVQIRLKGIQCQLLIEAGQIAVDGLYKRSSLSDHRGRRIGHALLENLEVALIRMKLFQQGIPVLKQAAVALQGKKIAGRHFGDFLVEKPSSVSRRVQEDTKIIRRKQYRIQQADKFTGLLHR